MQQGGGDIMAVYKEQLRMLCVLLRRDAAHLCR